jgi:hypothetical protein
VQGVYGAEDRNVLEVHEDLSTGATQQFDDGVEFRKRSNIGPSHENFQGPICRRLSPIRIKRILLACHRCFTAVST